MLRTSQILLFQKNKTCDTPNFPSSFHCKLYFIKYNEIGFKINLT